MKYNSSNMLFNLITPLGIWIIPEIYIPVPWLLSKPVKNLSSPIIIAYLLCLSSAPANVVEFGCNVPIPILDIYGLKLVVLFPDENVLVTATVTRQKAMKDTMEKVEVSIWCRIV
jgi:hypothetical protein